MALFYSFYGWVEFHCIHVHFFLILSSVDRHLGCFHVLAIVNSAALNIQVDVSFWIVFFSRYVPRSGIAGSYDISYFFIFNFYLFIFMSILFLNFLLWLVYNVLSISPIFLYLVFWEHPNYFFLLLLWQVTFPPTMKGRVPFSPHPLQYLLCVYLLWWPFSLVWGSALL